MIVIHIGDTLVGVESRGSYGESAQREKLVMVVKVSYANGFKYTLMLGGMLLEGLKRR